MRTPRSAASFAASSVSMPVVRRPSLSNTMAADSYEPGATGATCFGGGFACSSRLRPWRALPNVISPTSKPWSGNSSDRHSTIALPIAVPVCIWKPSMAVTSDSRSRVARCATWLLPANVTRPTSTCLGKSRRNSFAASCAAASRVGLTSLTRMLSDTSIAIMVEVRPQGSGTRATGRAAAKTSHRQASSSKAGGTWRRQLRAAAPRGTMRLLYCKACLRRRCSSHTYTTGSSASTGSNQNDRGQRKNIVRRAYRAGLPRSRQARTRFPAIDLVEDAAQPAVGRIVLHAPMPVLLHLDLRRLERQLDVLERNVPPDDGRDVLRHRRHEIAARQQRKQAHEMRELQRHVPMPALVLEEAVQEVLAPVRTHHDVARGEVLLDRHACAGRGVARGRDAYVRSL